VFNSKKPGLLELREFFGHSYPGGKEGESPLFLSRKGRQKVVRSTSGTSISLRDNDEMDFEIPINVGARE
jgi:hypothetical protein